MFKTEVELMYHFYHHDRKVKKLQCSFYEDATVFPRHMVGITATYGNRMEINAFNLEGKHISRLVVRAKGE